MLWLGMTIFTIGEMISSPTASAYLARIAPEQMRGRYMGALALAWNAAGIFGPQLGFRLYAIDPLLLWLGYGLLGLVGAWAILRASQPVGAP
jgi:MFS family permease